MASLGEANDQMCILHSDWCKAYAAASQQKRSANSGPKIYVIRISWTSSRPLLAYDAQSPCILTSRLCKR